MHVEQGGEFEEDDDDDDDDRNRIVVEMAFQTRIKEEKRDLGDKERSALAVISLIRALHSA